MKIIVFYGTDCDDKTAWIPWLKEQLTNQGIECVIPNLPTPENQTYASWTKITNEEISSIEQRYVGKGYGEFKKEVADKVCELLEQIQKRFTHFNNTELLDEIVKKGAYKAQMTAQETLARATKALGLN